MKFNVSLIFLLFLTIFLFPAISSAIGSYQYSLEINVGFFEIINPTGDGDYTSWTGYPSGTPTYPRIDDNWLVPDDTDYIFTSGTTSGVKTSYTFENWSGSATFSSVILYTRTKVSVSGQDINVYLRSGSPASDTYVAQLDPTTSFKTFNIPMSVNPATSGTWTQSEIDDLEIVYSTVYNSGSPTTWYISQVYTKVLPATIDGETTVKDELFSLGYDFQDLVDKGYADSSFLDSYFQGLWYQIFNPYGIGDYPTGRMRFFLDDELTVGETYTENMYFGAVGYPDQYLYRANEFPWTSDISDQVWISGTTSLSFDDEPFLIYTSVYLMGTPTAGSAPQYGDPIFEKKGNYSLEAITVSGSPMFRFSVGDSGSPTYVEIPATLYTWTDLSAWWTGTSTATIVISDGMTQDTTTTSGTLSTPAVDQHLAEYQGMMDYLLIFRE